MKLFTKTIALAILLAPSMMRLSAQSTMTALVTTPACNNNGVISVTVAGLTPPISYTYTNWWANINIVHSGVNSTNDALTGVPAFQSQWGNPNEWMVFASDGTVTMSDSVHVTPPFTYSLVALPGNCPSPNTLQAYVGGGSAPYTYLWTNTMDNSTYNTNPAFVTNGQYSLVVTDNSGCMVTVPSGSSSIWVTSNSTITLNMSATAANCTNGTASVTVTGGVSPYSYLWNNNATSPNLSGLVSGNYNVTVTDNIGCQKVGYINVNQAVQINFNSTITHPTCLQNDGAITGFVNGGTAPYTFAWSNAATTQNISGLAAGSYNVMILDANNCKGIGYAYLVATTPISITQTSTPSSCTAATGGATIFPTGGTAPYNTVWYTFPTNTTGNSINNVPSGLYTFVVTDAVGCKRTGSVFVPPVSTINGAISAPHPVCPSTTGTVAVSASGSNPPFTYQWSNSSTSNVLSNVPLGVYTCTITDNVGCKVIKNAVLSQTSPVTIGLNSNNVNCLYDTNGSIIANGSGGTAPYTYTWTNNVNTPANTSLGVGIYWVTVTDANGCKATKMGSIANNGTSNNCYCTITGTVYADANSNCTRDAGENGIPNVQIHCSGHGYAYTNSNGVYNFKVPSGSYTITETINQIYPLATCQNNNLVVVATASNNCVNTLNFANNVIPVSDLRITPISNNLPVPGNVYSQKVVVSNDGTINESNIQLGYEHDGQLSFSNCAPWALTQQNATSYPNWYSVTSGFPSLAPAASSWANITYNVPTNIPVNTQVSFKDSVAKNAPIATQWLTDDTPWNNVRQYSTHVVASYDPNYKEVSPQGKGATGDITHSDSVLTYVVHFQNTGNYYAQNVVVIDSLDQNLNIKTMKPGYAQHDCRVTMTDNGVATFGFYNINLPWQSNFGDEQSSGLFMYTVRLKPNLPVGTQIRNKAAIYFDYNEPIITNTTLNTLVKSGGTTALESYRLPDDGAMLFPNPTSGNFQLVVQSKQLSAGTMKVYDLSGREVSVQTVRLGPGMNTIKGESSDLSEGIYIVQLSTDEFRVSRKLSVRK